MKKVAIVTAASKGMGAACARQLKNEDYELVLLARSANIHDLGKELGAATYQGSVTNKEDLTNIVELAMDKFGRIDAVVNNTGHPPKGALLDLKDEEWHEGMDLVLMNVIQMSKIVTPIMLRQGSGAFVNISTFAAFEPSLTFPISSVLRAALGSYTKLYSDRYGKHDIRMNNVLPGFVDSYDVSEEIRNQIPMRREGKVSEVAKTVSFLLSSGSSYINGQNIKVDGGLTRSIS